jgi:hypothetical protein
MIKSAKLAMRIVLKNWVVTQEVLSTVMIGIEALMNARPLTPVSSDPTAVDALTPNHFLQGRPNIQLHADFDAQPQLLSNRRWMNAQEIVNHVWNRWMREYLLTLIERTKWLRPRRNLAVGDVVLVEPINKNPKLAQFWEKFRIFLIRMQKWVKICLQIKVLHEKKNI